MRARHRNTSFQTHQLGQHQSPGNHRNLCCTGCQHLRIVICDGTGDDNGSHPFDVILPMTDDHTSPESCQTACHSGLLNVRTTDGVAQIEQYLSNATHPRAANTDKMYMFDTMLHAASRTIS